MESRAPGVIISADNLHRHFQLGDETVAALDGVSLEIRRGEFFGIGGPSGSGKSTLLYIIGGMDRPTAGRVFVQGQDISTMDENVLADYRCKCVGFVYQSFHLVPTMTALQNVELPMLFTHLPLKQRRERARYLLEAVGLGNRIHHRPTEMSGGQRQRVAIARAMSNQPAVILADEPTGNLDTRNGSEVIERLQSLCLTEGVTTLVVSHDSNVLNATDRCVYLHDGQILEEINHGA
jgi:putative ABC transport system ATP-binding protein